MKILKEYKYLLHIIKKWYHHHFIKINNYIDYDED